MYKLVAIAGTFDRLHKGHRFFISEAFKLGERVIIGLTTDEYVKEKLKVLSSRPPSRDPSRGAWIPGQARNDKLNNVEEFVTRKKELEKFLQENNFLERAKIVTIDDVYGPAIDPTSLKLRGARRNDIEALVVTSDTLEGGRKVNRKRRELGFNPLKLLQIPLIFADDHRRVASTRIRLGEIDRWGRLYKLKIKNEKLKINERVRRELKKPLGILIHGDPQNHKEILAQIKSFFFRIKPVMLITVGDEVTKFCNESEINSDLSIIDFRVGRIKKYFSLSDLGFTSLAKSDLVRVRNPAGSITASTVHAVNQAMKNLVVTGQQQIIKVIGEEDLAGVPAILLAPLGSLVLYGQPREGVVLVEVTEEKKQEILKILLI